MASYYKLDLEERKKLGTSAARSIRRNGDVLVNYYYTGEENKNFSIDKKSLQKAIQSGNRVFELDINNETIYAMIKEAQYHRQIPICHPLVCAWVYHASPIPSTQCDKPFVRFAQVWDERRCCISWSWRRRFHKFHGCLVIWLWSASPIWGAIALARLVHAGDAASADLSDAWQAFNVSRKAVCCSR